MQDDQQPPETLNVLGGEVEKNRFDGNNAPIVKDSSGSITIIYNYSPDTQNTPHCSLGAVRDENANVIPFQENRLGSSEAIQFKDKLNELLAQKEDLQRRLEYVESEINRIESFLKIEVNPSIFTLLDWLSGRKYLAEKYGKIALRGFRNLKQEAEAKGTLDDFYFQIENYWELIYWSLSKNKKLFLREPQIPPTFADFDIYDHASQGPYKEVFRVLKENIPKDNVESPFRTILEDHFDELLERLKAYF